MACEPQTPVPEVLLQPSPKLQEPQSADSQAIIENHLQNMTIAGECFAGRAALIEAIKARQE